MYFCHSVFVVVQAGENSAATYRADTCPPTGRPSQVKPNREVKATHSRLSFLLSPLTSLLVRKVFKYTWEKLSGRNMKCVKFNFEREFQNSISQNQKTKKSKVACPKGNLAPLLTSSIFIDRNLQHMVTRQPKKHRIEL